MIGQVFTLNDLSELASRTTLIQIKKRKVYAKPDEKTKSVGYAPFEWVGRGKKKKLQHHGKLRFQSLNYTFRGELAKGLSTKKARELIKGI